MKMGRSHLTAVHLAHSNLCRGPILSYEATGCSEREDHHEGEAGHVREIGNLNWARRDVLALNFLEDHYSAISNLGRLHRG